MWGVFGAVRNRPAVFTILALAWSVGSWASGPFDVVGVRALPPASPYRLYIADVAIPHIVDGKLHVVDGQAMKHEAMVATGMAGHAVLSPDRGELYVVTSYYARLNRGERVDQVDIYDASNLTLKAEVPVPPKHAQALPYRGLLRTSGDGRWLFVQNATPATSVSVVDLKERRFVTEIQTPGCWIVVTVPGAPQRFSTLCGDGSLLTVTLSADGQVADQQRAPGFFDPDADALFVHAETLGDTAYFVSFNGRVHSARLDGATASFEPAWSLVVGPDAKAGWRPGGYQPLALHRESGRLFVGMHPGGKEGSHKEPAREIWVVDLATRKRLARVPGSHAIALNVTRGERPLLFAIDGAKGALVSWDARTAVPKPRAARVEPIGEASTLIEVH